MNNVVNEELTLVPPTRQEALPKGILTLIGDYSPEDLCAFKRLWEREFGTRKPLVLVSASDADILPVGPIRVQVKRLPHGEGLPLPRFTTSGAACMDVYAAESFDIYPDFTVSVPTGFCFALPEGWEMQVRSRSGLAAKNRVTVLNAPGTLDCDYRGELFVLLRNEGGERYTVHRGDRVAQIAFKPVYRAEFEEVEYLPETARGEGGFGSTGR